MTVVASHAGAYKEAKELYAAYDGEWHQVPLGASEEWTRPDDWLETDVAAGQQKIQVLVQIGQAGSPETQRAMTVAASGAAYTVNWGDGTAAENKANGVVATHMYDPAALAGTLTSDGWLQALVTITPQAGNITSLNLANAYFAGKTWRSPVVELVVGPPLTTLTLSALCPRLHRVELKSTLTVASGGNLFAECRLLREIVGEVAVTGTTVTSIFQGCALLTRFPTLTLSPSVVTGTSMFNGCASMVESPPFASSQMTTMNAMFNLCVRLKRLPPGFSTAAATNTSSMFATCTVLEELPLLDTALATNMNSMFNGCNSLREVSFTSTAANQNATSMFGTCLCLESLTGLDFSSVSSSANLGNAFLSCFRLSTLQFLADKGPKFSFTLQALLDAAGLDAVYTALPTVTGQTITVTSVPGTLGDNPAIATAKGWTVTGS